MTKHHQGLDSQQIQFFMQHGYVKIEGAFTRSQAAEMTKDLWTRLGMRPDDKQTWDREWINMPGLSSQPTAELQAQTSDQLLALNRYAVKDFSPRAWAAICDLVGGEDRIAEEERCRSWNDAWIVNLGRKEYDDAACHAPSAKDIVGLNNQLLRNDNVGWHCDGDWFLHLVVPLYSDILPGGGGTYVAPQSIDKVARYLAEHSEGVHPTGFDFAAIRDECDEFVELTGNVGDCVLMHPFMLHAASPNRLRIPRIITNPACSLGEPYKLKRENPDDFCLVELKTLQSLGVDPIQGYDFVPQSERIRIVPERQVRQEAEKVRELQRLNHHSAIEKEV